MIGTAGGPTKRAVDPDLQLQPPAEQVDVPALQIHLAEDAHGVADLDAEAALEADLQLGVVALEPQVPRRIDGDVRGERRLGLGLAGAPPPGPARCRSSGASRRAARAELVRLAAIDRLPVRRPARCRPDARAAADSSAARPARREARRSSACRRRGGARSWRVADASSDSQRQQLALRVDRKAVHLGRELQLLPVAGRGSACRGGARCPSRPRTSSPSSKIACWSPCATR